MLGSGFLLADINSPPISLNASSSSACSPYECVLLAFFVFICCPLLFFVVLCCPLLLFFVTTYTAIVLPSSEFFQKKFFVLLNVIQPLIQSIFHSTTSSFFPHRACNTCVHNPSCAFCFQDNSPNSFCLPINTTLKQEGGEICSNAYNHTHFHPITTPPAEVVGGRDDDVTVGGETWKMVSDYCMTSFSWIATFGMIIYLVSFSPGRHASFELSFIHPHIRPSIHTSIHTPIHPYIHPKLHIFFYTSIHPSIHPSILFHPFRLTTHYSQCMHSFMHPSFFPMHPSFLHHASILLPPCIRHSSIHVSIHASTHSSIRNGSNALDNQLRDLSQLGQEYVCFYSNQR